VAVYKTSNSGLLTRVQYTSFLAGNSTYIPSDYESIATANGTGSSNVITFSSIPSDYTHLQVRVFNYTSSGDNLAVRFNNDTGSNYAYHQLTADGASLASAGIANHNLMLGGYSSASHYGVSIIDIVDYKNTNKYKTTRSIQGSDANGSGFIILRSGLWQNTSAVNRIDLFANNNFTTASQFALYGIRG
jgi:hypothetical protein